jgi:hypothetical protein
MVLVPKIDELKSLFTFEEVSVGDYIYDLQIKSDVKEESEKQVGSLFICFAVIYKLLPIVLMYLYIILFIIYRFWS